MISPSNFEGVPEERGSLYKSLLTPINIFISLKINKIIYFLFLK
jgi:hypothetical protein